MLLKSNTISLTIVLSLFLFNCKKVNLPNPQAEGLIGEWTYISSTSGMSGMGAPDFKGTTIEFKKSGKFFRYDSKKKKMYDTQFEFKEASCIHGDKHPKIKIAYKTEGFDSFLISNDTLYLDSEAHDGISQIYIRK